MKETFQKRFPDYSGKNQENKKIGVWIEKAKNGNEYLAIKIEGEKGIAVFKN